MNENRAIQRRKAAYAHAVGEALAHVPAGDREAILADLEEHIEDALSAAGGSPDLDQLEQILAAMGSPEAYAADVRPAIDRASIQPRLCRKAVVGLAWSISFVFIAIPLLFTARVDDGEATTSLGWRLIQILGFLSLAGGIGGPLLSGIGITQIRHSGGRLIGMGMAVVGAWLIPLILLDVFAFSMVQSAAVLIENPKLASALQALAALVIVLLSIVCLLALVRRANRAARATPALAA